MARDALEGSSGAARRRDGAVRPGRAGLAFVEFLYKAIVIGAGCNGKLLNHWSLHDACSL